MQITRRQFLTYCTSSAAALGLQASELGALRKALANPNAPSVVWLIGSSCCGCSVSLLDRIASVAPESAYDLLADNINLVFHPVVMAAAGDLAAQTAESQLASGGYVLVVEGGVPTAFGGHACIAWSNKGQEVTFQDALQNFAASAAAIVCVGTCASFGGVSASGSNPTGLKGVGTFLGKPVINLPGCPPHPDWIIWAVVQLLLGKPVALDPNRRPTAIYGHTIHSRCPYREAEETETFGIPGRCLEELGCRGPSTRANCQSVKWNNKVNWCIGAGAPCIGCTEPGFPGTYGFYQEDGGDD